MSSDICITLSDWTFRTNWFWINTKESFPNSYRKWWLQNPLVLGINIIFTMCLYPDTLSYRRFLLSCLLTKLYSIWLEFHSNAVQGVNCDFRIHKYFTLRSFFCQNIFYRPFCLHFCDIYCLRGHNDTYTPRYTKVFGI